MRGITTLFMLSTVAKVSKTCICVCICTKIYNYILIYTFVCSYNLPSWTFSVFWILPYAVHEIIAFTAVDMGMHDQVVS